MTQQLLSLAGARTLTPADIVAMTDEQANDTFKKLRWPETDGKPVCPRCYSRKVYILKTRGTFKCSECKRHFSMTSETIFASRKMPVRDYLMAIALFYNAHAVQSALGLSREMKVQYRTAYSLAQRMRTLAQGQS